MLGYTPPPHPVDRMNDTRLWKHYLPATSFVGGNKGRKKNVIVFSQSELGACCPWTYFCIKHSLMLAYVLHSLWNPPHFSSNFWVLLVTFNLSSVYQRAQTKWSERKRPWDFAGRVSEVFSFGFPITSGCQIRGTLRARNRRESSQLKKYEGAGDLVQLLVLCQHKYNQNCFILVHWPGLLAWCSLRACKLQACTSGHNWVQGRDSIVAINGAVF